MTHGFPVIRTVYSGSAPAAAPADNLVLQLNASTTVTVTPSGGVHTEHVTDHLSLPISEVVEIIQAVIAWRDAPTLAASRAALLARDR